MNLLSLSHTVVAVDVVGSTAGSRARQAHLDRSLERAVDRIFDALARSPYARHIGFRRTDGDSATIALPAAVPRAWVAAEFVLRELPSALDSVNETVVPADWLRVRVAIDHGEVLVDPPHIAGDAVRNTARLRDADPLRAALRAAPEANLGLIVSDRFFQEVISNRELGLDPAVFREVRVAVKDYRGVGWLHVPGRAPSALAPRGQRYRAELIDQFPGRIDLSGADFGLTTSHG